MYKSISLISLILVTALIVNSDSQITKGPDEIQETQRLWAPSTNQTCLVCNKGLKLIDGRCQNETKSQGNTQTTFKNASN